LSQVDLPRFILDTNILLDLFVFDDAHVHPLHLALKNQQIEAIASPKTLLELADVISRSQFQLTKDKQAIILQEWQNWARIVDDEALAKAPWKCKDRDDQIFINLAYAYKPAVLISKDLEILKLAKRAEKEGVLICPEFTGS